MKRITAIFSAVMLLICLLAACGGNTSDSSSPGTAGDSSGTAGGNTSAGTSDDSAGGAERITLRILSSSGQGEWPEGSDENNNIFVDFLREVTGYDFEYTFYNDDESRNALIASGQQYDMIRLPGGSARSGATMLALQQQGFLNPVDEYLPQMANIMNPAQTPESAWAECQIDGVTYGIPNAWHELYFALGVRVDWMDNLGLSAPETMADFKNMLIAFRDNDPDGNGVNDTIPLAASALDGVLRLFRGFYNIPGEYMDVGGNVTYTVATDRGKEMVAAMAEFYAEGLIDPEFAITTDEIVGQRITSGMAAASATWWWDMKEWDRTFKENLGVDESPFWWVAPPQNIDGQPTKFQSCGPIEQTLVFPAGGHTYEAINLLNIMLDPDVAETLIFGFYGEHWDYDENGDRYLTEAYDDIVWRWHYCDGIMFEHEMMAISEDLEYGPYRIPVQEWAGGEASWSLPLPPVVGIELQELDIAEYTELELIKFVMGDRPMSEYDAFIEELNQKGLQEVLAVKQSVYNP